MAEAAGGLLYVLLPVHNRRAVTEGFLGCLARQTDRRFHLVLLDDGSTDGTADMARAAGLPLTVLAGRGDWWWAGALHAAWRWLRAQPDGGDACVAIMNDDTRFGPEFLAAGRAALARQPRTLVLAHAYSAHTGALLDAGARADWATLRFLPAEPPSAADCLSTRGLFLRLGDFLALGGFHPVLLPHYGSDYEFTLRARRRGYRLAVEPSLRLEADERSTGDRDAGAASLGEFLRRRFSTRSSRNPLHWSALVLLACPARWLPLNLFRVWRDFLVEARQAARGGR